MSATPAEPGSSGVTPIVLSEGVVVVEDDDTESSSDPGADVVDVGGRVVEVVSCSFGVVDFGESFVDPVVVEVCVVLVVASSTVVVVDGDEVVAVDVVVVDVVVVDEVVVDEVVVDEVVVVVASKAPRISTLSIWAVAPSDRSDEVMNRTPVDSEIKPVMSFE
jgi:hypothetical protein